MQGFISYSRRDTEFVKPLYESLTALGYEVWIDQQDIDGGGHGYWKESVVEAIADSDTFIVVLSPNSTGSDSVEKELNVAAGRTRRLIPVMHQQCELTGTFLYELGALQYIDFPALGFDEGVRRLAIRIGPPANPPEPRPPWPSPNPTPWWRQPRTMAVAGVAALLLLIGGVAIALAGGNDDESSADTASPTLEATGSTARDTTVNSTTATTVGTDGTTTPSDATTERTSPPPAGQAEAEGLVAAWAEATSRRDFEEAARIDTSRDAASLENLYRPVEEPTRMLSVEPYIAESVQQGSLWQVVGAAMALDYAPEPETRTHVICSEWIVDVAAGTLVWEDRGGPFIAPAIPAEEFPDLYTASCT